MIIPSQAICESNIIKYTIKPCVYQCDGSCQV